MMYSFNDTAPVISPGCFIAPDAAIIGDVEIREESSVWFGAVLRGDINCIRVGACVNIQDRAVLHVDHDTPCILGDWVSVGHSAVVHGATVEDGCLIGMGAVVLSHTHIGAGSVIGAGAVITEGMEIPPRSLVLGVPGKVVRTLEADRHPGRDIAESYNKLMKKYLSNEIPESDTPTA